MPKKKERNKPRNTKPKNRTNNKKKGKERNNPNHTTQRLKSTTNQETQNKPNKEGTKIIKQHNQ